MAQSASRQSKRISLGLQNPAPSSSKISKHTEAPKSRFGRGGITYRSNRFK